MIAPPPLQFAVVRITDPHGYPLAYRAGSTQSYGRGHLPSTGVRRQAFPIPLKTSTGSRKQLAIKRPPKNAIARLFSTRVRLFHS